MKFTVLMAIIPALATATGVFGGVCIDENNNKQYVETKDCCAFIGGGKHFFSDSQCECVSLGGIAFRRVWKEALQECCASRGMGTKTCNDECSFGVMKCEGMPSGTNGS